VADSNQHRQYDIKKAAALTILGAIAMSVMALFVKLAAPHTSNSMTIFFRFGVSLIYVLFVLLFRCMRGHAFPKRSKNLKLQIFRAVAGMLGMLLFYYALAFIPLVDGNLLMMTNALFVPILAFAIFRYRTGLKSWSFIVLGFVGVVLVIKPGHELFNAASLLALASGFCAALSFLTLREVTKYDGPYTNMIYYFTLAFVMSGIVSIFHWHFPDKHTLCLLLLVGLFATIYQECLVRASFYAPARVISSFLYVSVVVSGILGWWVFNEIPGYLSWVGMILVFVSSVCTAIEE